VEVVSSTVVLLLPVVALWLAMGMLPNFAVVPGVSIYTKLTSPPRGAVVLTAPQMDYFRHCRRQDCLGNGNMWDVSSEPPVLFSLFGSKLNRSSFC
jgi:hypothetical protein